MLAVILRLHVDVDDAGHGRLLFQTPRCGGASTWGETRGLGRIGKLRQNRSSRDVLELVAKSYQRAAGVDSKVGSARSGWNGTKMMLLDS